MLNDFSDYFGISVYDLGTTLIELGRVFSFDKDSVFLPPPDLKLFVTRFVDRLQLGSKKTIVEKFCFRLVDSMKRNWIQTGRHPAGILGAAMYISSNMLDLPRSKNDIARIVNIAEQTLEKRISEFNLTDTSFITNIESNSPDCLVNFESRSKETEECRDPPAYTAVTANSNRKIKFMEPVPYRSKIYSYFNASQHRINKIKRSMMCIDLICFMPKTLTRIRYVEDKLLLRKILVKSQEIKTREDFSASYLKKDMICVRKKDAFENVVVDVIHSIRFKNTGKRIVFTKEFFGIVDCMRIIFFKLYILYIRARSIH
eukprot:gnl/TRDRNA2_/TRDRNA2_177525_c1_seq3.p1 gnl/TRDRNA2_/TRDRNA2_177525_c1~~gnl/TRDRNA2_/TRDRNA2_177525_c1_seq3.p1  ORF type:complete len:315 (+),score=-23.88 gnl/TRDRNA2_/TRDRNA2_177525_c1_seq3:292-1236(+)